MSTCSTPVRALTLRRPWGWAITHAGKPVENRSWSTRYRGPLLIHQGQGTDPDAAAWFLPLAQAIAAAPDDPLTWIAGVILGGVTLTDCHRAEPGCCPSLWAMPGQWHWLLTDPWALAEPVPARGSRQLWVPAPHVLERLPAA